MFVYRARGAVGLGLGASVMEWPGAHGIRAIGVGLGDSVIVFGLGHWVKGEARAIHWGECQGGWGYVWALARWGLARDSGRGGRARGFGDGLGGLG